MLTSNNETKKILEELRKPFWDCQPIGSTTDFIVKIIKQHFQTTLLTDAEDCAKEIEKIIYEKLLDGWNAGFRSGKIKQHNEIDEALRLYQQEYANTKISERPNGWTVLQDIKKLNEHNKSKKTIR